MCFHYLFRMLARVCVCMGGGKGKKYKTESNGHQCRNKQPKYIEQSPMSKQTMKNRTNNHDKN